MDPSCLSCIEPQEVSSVQGVQKGGETTFSLVVDGDEEYEVEVILKHKDKGARGLYLVMWKR